MVSYKIAIKTKMVIENLTARQNVSLYCRYLQKH